MREVQRVHKALHICLVQEQKIQLDKVKIIKKDGLGDAESLGEELSEGPKKKPSATFSSETQRVNRRFSRRLNVYDEKDPLQRALIKHGSARVFRLCANRLPSVRCASVALIGESNKDS